MRSLAAFQNGRLHLNLIICSARFPPRQSKTRLAVFRLFALSTPTTMSFLEYKERFPRSLFLVLTPDHTHGFQRLLAPSLRLSETEPTSCRFLGG